MTGTEDRFQVDTAGPPDNSRSEMIQWHGSALHRTDAMAFVGPNFNRYWFQWRKMADTGSLFSWNWASALFGVAWLGSRRMHKLAALILIAAAVLWFLAGASAGPGGEEGLGVFVLVYLAATFAAFGLIGNTLYRRHTARALETALNSEVTPESRVTHLRHTGGRSFAIAIAWAVGAYLLLPTAYNLGFANSPHPSPMAAQAPGPTATAIPRPPQSPNDRYFTQERFYNPPVIRMLYESNIVELTSLPEQARAPVTIYAISAADQIEEVCGEFLSVLSTTQRGILRFALGVVSFAAAIEAVSQEFSQGPDSELYGLLDWLVDIESLGAIDTQAKRDVSVFLRDTGSCTDKRVFQLKDGLDLYFRS